MNKISRFCLGDFLKKKPTKNPKQKKKPFKQKTPKKITHKVLQIFSEHPGNNQVAAEYKITEVALD